MFMEDSGDLQRPRGHGVPLIFRRFRRRRFLLKTASLMDMFLYLGPLAIDHSVFRAVVCNTKTKECCRFSIACHATLAKPPAQFSAPLRPGRTRAECLVRRWRYRPPKVCAAQCFVENQTLSVILASTSGRETSSARSHRAPPLRQDVHLVLVSRCARPCSILSAPHPVLSRITAGA